MDSVNHCLHVAVSYLFIWKWSIISILCDEGEEVEDSCMQASVIRKPFEQTV